MVVAGALFLLGLGGTVLPVLPGPLLVWLGMLAYGFFAGFSGLPVTFYLWQALAAAVAMTMDYLAGVWGTRRYGGSHAAVWGSILGGLLGVAVLGPAGIILGPLAGAVDGELLAGRTARQALRAGWGTLLGFLGGVAVKLAIQLAMIAWFLAVIF